MSDESRSPELGAQRLLTSEEAALMRQILEASEVEGMSAPDLSSLKVREMLDSGMGSLYIEHPQKTRDSRRFGRRIGEILCHDSDGIDVLVSLNVDKDDDLYELDIWKTDFSPVIKLGFWQGRPG